MATTATTATTGSVGRFISEPTGCLRLEISKDGQNELDEVCRSLAVICVSRQVRRVLLVAEQGHAEHVLREALSTMLLAGIPADFRLALVADSCAIADCYRQVMGDLKLAAVDARMFADEDEALGWLTGPDPVA